MLTKAPKLSRFLRVCLICHCGDSTEALVFFGGEVSDEHFESFSIEGMGFELLGLRALAERGYGCNHIWRWYRNWLPL